MIREEINQVVVNTFKQVAKDNDKSLDGEPTADTAIMGPDSAFDSVDLVTFIVALEQALEDDWNVSIILADDRAMSQSVSPFKTIGSISDYIDMLVKENK
jgi:acyl carrier protein